MRAVYNGNTNAVRAMLDNDATLINQYRDRDTPLIVAARHGDVGMVSLLLARGADVHAMRLGAASETALKVAAAAGNLPVVKLLLEHGARSCVSKDAGSALGAACWAGHLAVAEAILEHGGWEEGEDGHMPLSGAAVRGWFNILKTILCAGVCRNEDGVRWQGVQSEGRGFTACASLLKVRAGL